MHRAVSVLVLVLAACSSAGGSEAVPSSVASESATIETLTTTTEPAVPPIPAPAVVGSDHTSESWFLVSVTASLPEGLVRRLAAIEGVDAVSTVAVGLVPLVKSRTAEGTVADEAPDGFVIPLEAQAFVPSHHAEFVPADVAEMMQSLAVDEVLLSESSAAFRRLGPGSMLFLDDGAELTVVGVVADEWVGAAEIAITSEAGMGLGVVNERYSVVRYDGPRTDLDRLVNASADDVVRVRARDEVDVFRHADAVASQITIKERFGEFAYRPLGGDAIEIDPDWVRDHIVRAEIPLLGEVRCHVEFVPLLRTMMERLEAEGEGAAIDRGAFRGCFNPRHIRNRRDLSRHAWGVAADINFGNPSGVGPGSPSNEALVDAAAAAGIASGHAWTNPGPGHFEWNDPDGR